MYVRVTRGRYNRAEEAEIVRLVRDLLLPNARLLPGFRGFHSGLDREHGRLVAVSLWDTREQSEALASGRVPFEALGVEFDPAEAYEVIASG
jgi:hypothetical protein